MRAPENAVHHSISAALTQCTCSGAEELWWLGNFQPTAPETQWMPGLLLRPLEPPGSPGNRHRPLWCPMYTDALVNKMWFIVYRTGKNLKSWRLRYLCGRESGDEISVRWCLSWSCRCHWHDWWCWCGHGHGDRGLGHHGLLVLGHDGGHGHSQGGQVGHWWRGELTQDFHIHCRQATLEKEDMGLTMIFNSVNNQ